MGHIPERKERSPLRRSLVSDVHGAVVNMTASYIEHFAKYIIRMIKLRGMRLAVCVARFGRRRRMHIGSCWVS
jgi:hypothetical protein